MRAQANHNRRTVTLQTLQRSVDLPVDSAGHVRRAVTKAEIQLVRAASTGGDTGFDGRFIPFGQRQWIGSKRWGFWETNVAGAINKTIQERNGVNNDITLNREHDNQFLLARTSNSTLRLTADDSYGRANADMGAYSYTSDVITGIDRGDLTGMSYAFDIIDWSWDTADDGHDHLFIREMALFDTAIVGMPANVDTDSTLRMDLLSVARNAGFDIGSFDMLARRLADPDVEVVEMLRSLTVAPGDTTHDGAPPEGTLREVVNEIAYPHPLTLRMLSQRTQMQGASTR